MKVMNPSADGNGYQSDDGHTVKREYGTTPNGNPMAGRWVLRDPAGQMLDFNQYRHDLFEHNGYLPPY